MQNEIKLPEEVKLIRKRRKSRNLSIDIFYGLVAAGWERDQFTASDHYRFIWIYKPYDLEIHIDVDASCNMLCSMYPISVFDEIPTHPIFEMQVDLIHFTRDYYYLIRKLLRLYRELRIAHDS